jgi:predicted transcriptional regulator
LSLNLWIAKDIKSSGMMTHKEIDDLKSLVDEIADILTRQRVVNERNIKSVQKAEDFIRDSIKHLKAAQAELYKANTEEKG